MSLSIEQLFELLSNAGIWKQSFYTLLFCTH